MAGNRQQQQRRQQQQLCAVGKQSQHQLPSRLFWWPRGSSSSGTSASAPSPLLPLQKQQQQQQQKQRLSLFRALTFVLISVATATGAGASPEGLRFSASGNHHQQQQGLRARRQAQGDQQQQEQQQQSSQRRQFGGAGWVTPRTSSNSKSSSTTTSTSTCSSRGRQQTAVAAASTAAFLSPAPPASSAAATAAIASSSFANPGRVAPATTRVGARTQNHHPHHHHSRCSSSSGSSCLASRRRRTPGWRAWEPPSQPQQQQQQQQWAGSRAAAATAATKATASLLVAQPLPKDVESSSTAAGAAAAAGGGKGTGTGALPGRVPLRRRQRGNGKEGGDWRPSLYMREGLFQALPFPVRITVMGGGNFGLALSLVLARNQIPTTLLVRTTSVADHVNKHNEHPNYLKGIKLPRHIVATADPEEALHDATYIIHAVPVQYTRKFLENVVQHMPPGAPILSVSKGIETSSLMLMNDILKDVCGAHRSYAFLSGPSFAREIAMNQATAVVIASDDSCLANDMAKVLSSPTFRCFTSKDVIGVEVGGAVKNVIALAAGMCEGLGLGTNAMAGLVTRGCGEMRRMAIILGGKSRTLSGLSGVGDTFGTCFGPLSRNRNFGIRLGKGESMEEILASSTEVAEGVDTALALADLIRKTDRSYRIDLKYAIIFGVADILNGERSPKEGLEDLMTMPLKAEMYDA